MPTPTLPTREPHDPIARMGDLATLPVFMKLAGKTALVVGGSGGTAWKAELMAAAGAHVRLVWAVPDPATAALLADWPDRITLVPRAFVPADLEGVAIAIGAIEEEAQGRAFAAAARAAGIPVNVVDRPHLCDFQFGAIVNRSPLLIGISTDGGAPPLGQAIRSQIEALLPAGLAAWARTAKTLRPRVARSGLDFGGRRGFWRAFADAALRRPEQAPCPVAWEATLAAWERGSDREDGAGQSGHLALVGAGPGDPELLTLKAVRLLRAADVVLHDEQVAAEILDFARREARKIPVVAHGEATAGAEANAVAKAASLAREGQRVVRLKVGDSLPLAWADAAIEAARIAGIPVTCVPAVSVPSRMPARTSGAPTPRPARIRPQPSRDPATDASAVRSPCPAPRSRAV